MADTLRASDVPFGLLTALNSEPFMPFPVRQAFRLNVFRVEKV